MSLHRCCDYLPTYLAVGICGEDGRGLRALGLSLWVARNQIIIAARLVRGSGSVFLLCVLALCSVQVLFPSHVVVLLSFIFMSDGLWVLLVVLHSCVGMCACQWVVRMVRASLEVRCAAQ